MKQNQTRQTRGFSLVELLVVIGIIAMLIGLLLPALSGARLQGQRIKCLANMNQIGVAMTIYSNDNRGLLIPIGPLLDGSQDLTSLVSPPPANMVGPVGDGAGNTAPFEYMTLGSEVYPWMRWPARLLTGGYAPIPPQADWPNYLVGEPTPGDPMGTIAAPWSSAMMICPSDPQPGADHSYLFNQHLVQNQDKVLKYSSKPPTPQQTNSTVVVLGEKRSIKDDYYMEQGDFPVDPTTASATHVELYRHGAKLGSNYLYKDMHAQNQPPQALSDQVDPWDIVPVNTTSSN